MAKGIKCVDHEGNEFNSLSKMCRHWGVNIATYLDRISRGMSIGDALTSESFRNKVYKDHQGNEFSSLTDMCKHYNIGIDTYKDRLARGFTQDEALREPLLRVFERWQVEDHTGRKFSSTTAMCIFYGISRATYSNRINKGWDKEKALTTPVRTMRHKES